MAVPVTLQPIMASEAVSFIFKTRFSNIKKGNRSLPTALRFNYFRINASLPLSTWLGRVGYIRKILKDGFNGIADIIWVVEFPEKMSGRSKDGKR